MLKVIFAACLASLSLPQAGHCMGISPSRSQPQAGNVMLNNGNNSYQMAPAPQPSSNLMNPGAMPPPPMQVGGAPQLNPEQQIQDSIKNYKPADWAKAWNHITLDQAKQMHEQPGVLFADARSKAEYDQGHIPGAVPLPLGEFDKYYKLYESKIKRATQLVTYCHGAGCQLSDKVAQKLYVDKKFRNVSAFFGGWPQWSESHLPIEVSSAPGKKK